MTLCCWAPPVLKFCHRMTWSHQNFCIIFRPVSDPSVIHTRFSGMKAKCCPPSKTPTHSIPRGKEEGVTGTDVSDRPLQYMKWSEVKVTQLCLTLCDPMDYIVHEILQARILEWVAFPFSRESSQSRDRTQVSCIAGRFFTSWAPREAQEHWSGQLVPSPADLPDPRIEPGSPALQADSLPTELSGKPIRIYTCIKFTHCLP